MSTNSTINLKVSEIKTQVEKLYLLSPRTEAHWLWDNHVQIVASNAAELSDTYGGRKDLTIVGALFHDVADIELERDHPDFAQ